MASCINRAKLQAVRCRLKKERIQGGPDGDRGTEQMEIDKENIISGTTKDVILSKTSTVQDTNSRRETKNDKGER